MGYTTIIIAGIVLCSLTVSSTLRGDCPPSSQVTGCSPTCRQDIDCSIGGGKCCPNLCNAKSCTVQKVGQTPSGYKGTGSSATGNYCGNVKCNSYEKCELDRSTKRMKCVRG